MIEIGLQMLQNAFSVSEYADKRQNPKVNREHIFVCHIETSSEKDSLCIGGRHDCAHSLTTGL